MPVIFYTIFLFLFKAGMLIISPFHSKAGKWVKGRRGLLRRLETEIPSNDKIIWMHCASLGEFEQGRPLLEKLRTAFPRYKVLLTFFSPSGYEVQKNYKGADWVFYLPMDGSRNAKRFLEIVKPSLVIFVKYEFWYYYLKKIKYRNIPLILVSALFRKDMNFFKWYGSLSRKMLSRFDHLFVQNQESAALLSKLGLTEKTTIAGDSRFDRVVEIAEDKQNLALIEAFVGQQKVIVAGSTWPEDEGLLQQSIEFLTANKIRLIIAPHEIDQNHLASLLNQFPNAILYSSLSAAGKSDDNNILIMDNVGLLSRIYRYAYCCYVGGGLRVLGVHNVLEAAVYSKPVFFGPHYTKYSEAVGLINTHGAYSVNNKDQFIAQLNQFILKPGFYSETAEKAGKFVRMNVGATQKIINYIQEKRLLTN